MQIWDRVSLSCPGQPWICHPPASAFQVAKIAHLYLPKPGLKFPVSVNDTFSFYSIIIIIDIVIGTYNKAVIMRFLLNPWSTVSCFHLGVYRGYKDIGNIFKGIVSCFRMKGEHSSNEPSGACFGGWRDRPHLPAMNSPYFLMVLREKMSQVRASIPVCMGISSWTHFCLCPCFLCLANRTCNSG